MKEPPDRIVTWAPSNTEILFALGLGDRVVGVSGPFDDYPPEAMDIQQVAGAGGVEPNVEVVVGLEPDLVLNGFLGGDEWKARLREAGVDVFSIYAADFDDALHDIETVGVLTSTEHRAEMIVASMRAGAEEVRTAAEQQGRVTCFFEVGYPDLFTVGPGDFPFDLLQIAGCDPVTSSADAPYPLWSVEQLVKDDPDVYILTTEAGVTPDEVAKRPGFGALSAVKGGRIVLVDSALITRPGPRLLEGLQVLAEGLHPEVAG
jgi:iron complex transport system substrate-binding protein